MKVRRRASIVQLAVFVVGGILGPVWHLAHHQHDHTHGHDVRPPLSIEAEGKSHTHVWDAGLSAPGAPADHTHSRAQPAGHDHHGPPTTVVTSRAHGPPSAHDADPSVPGIILPEGPHEHGAPGDYDSSPSQAPSDHGRGSVAHFGLVLPGVAAPPPLPLPEQGDRVVAVEAVVALSLFHPPCPLQRPPPAHTV